MAYRVMDRVVYRAAVTDGPAVMYRATMMDRMVHGVVYRVVRLRRRGGNGENGEQ